MSGLKEVAEGANAIVAHPATAKGVSAFTVVLGSAISLDFIQSTLGLVSAFIGILIGILVIKIKWKENKLIKLELERKLESQIKEDADDAC